jgi:hypothetical protein
MTPGKNEPARQWPGIFGSVEPVASHESQIRIHAPTDHPKRLEFLDTTR